MCMAMPFTHTAGDPGWLGHPVSAVGRTPKGYGKHPPDRTALTAYKVGPMGRRVCQHMTQLAEIGCSSVHDALLGRAP